MVVAGNPTYDIAAGGFACSIALVVLTIAIMGRSAIYSAVDCVKAACACVRENPSLWLHPFLALLAKVVNIGIAVAGFAHLLSSGLRWRRVGEKTLTSIELTELEWAYTLYYV